MKWRSLKWGKKMFSTSSGLKIKESCWTPLCPDLSRAPADQISGTGYRHHGDQLRSLTNCRGLPTAVLFNQKKRQGNQPTVTAHKSRVLHPSEYKT